MIVKTPLEAWISSRISGGENKPLTREDLERYQISRLNDMVRRLKLQSRFYRTHLKNVPDDAVRSLSDLASLPFTSFNDIAKDPVAFACVSQTKVSRVMTVSTSGTTGCQKRVFFTEEDQESTTDFFQYGMANLTDPGDRVLILLPGELPGSVGDLLRIALERLGASGHGYGFVDDPARVMDVINRESINVIVGIPVQVLSLLRNCKTTPGHQIKSVLLTTDYVPRAIIRAVENAWGCRVFNHYGMTEMGLGGGVQCSALGGYHMREADMLFEIVDCDTGIGVADGEYGEVVFTSLTAQGTPFIRCRTGDIARFLTSPCPCGTVLKSLDIIQGRLCNQVALSPGHTVRMRDFDEAMFGIDDVLDFEVSVSDDGGKTSLGVTVSTVQGVNAKEKILSALRGVLSIKHAENAGVISIDVRMMNDVCRRGAAKRIITDKRT